MPCRQRKEGTHMSDQISVKEIHAKLEPVTKRARADTAYRQQLQDQPLATLVAAGLSTSEAQAVLAGRATDDDVAGYGMTTGTTGGAGIDDTFDPLASFKDIISGRRK
jgi:hypothetical protein